MKKTLVEWYRKYELGHPQIDGEHRILLEKINVYWKLLEQNADFKNLLVALKDIGDYATFHFSSEEALMTQHSYPGLEKHREIHQHLLAQFSQRIGELGDASQDNIEAIKLYSYMVDWFIHHTTQEDRKLGDYLKHRAA